MENFKGGASGLAQRIWSVEAWSQSLPLAPDEKLEASAAAREHHTSYSV